MLLLHGVEFEMIAQNNKNQSKIRKNLTNILGLTEIEEKITVKNSDRIFGNVGSFYFGNTDPATGENKGCNCDDHPDNNDNNDNDNNDNDNQHECECYEVGTHGDPCCTTGRDCETGREVKVWRRGGSAMPCETSTPPPKPASENCQQFIVSSYGDDEWEFYQFASVKEIQSVVNTALEECIQNNFNFVSRFPHCNPQSPQPYGNPEIYDITDCGETVQLTLQKSIIDGSCPRSNNVTWKKINEATQLEYDLAVENLNKNAPKQYFAKGGKFYNACDPYGEPPKDCIDMCDSQGNKYRVCGNGNITKLS